jgi:hypothetical protein
MSERTEATPKRQYRRVAAWIYTVVNPVIESLQREVMLLDSENLTWRASSSRCEYIKLIQEYVDVKQWPNYSDYQLEHRAFLENFAEHDGNLKSLNGEAKGIYDWMLLSWKEYPVIIDECLTAYESARPSMGPQFPSFTNSRPELPKVAAENIINNIQSLPSHYVFAPFWNFASRQLLQYRNHSNFQSLHSLRAMLGQISSALKARLEDHRLFLSREFDVPAAPVPGITFGE